MRETKREVPLWRSPSLFTEELRFGPAFTDHEFPPAANIFLEGAVTAVAVADAIAAAAAPEFSVRDASAAFALLCGKMLDERGLLLIHLILKRKDWQIYCFKVVAKIASITNCIAYAPGSIEP